VLQQAAARGAKVQLEMGGKNPLVVLADADLDRAVDCALQGAFYSTGQRCTASSRLVVDAKVHDDFVARLRKRMGQLQVGHAEVRGIDIGPVASGAQMDQNLSYLEIARAEGAELVCGGEQLQRPTRGHFMSPALLLASPGQRVAREEIFGPVAAVLRADGYEHALRYRNDTPYGLCAGICTSSLKHASHFRRHAQAGMVMVNLPTAGVDYHVPFGGRKASSYGPREQGRHAVEFYTTVKTAYMLRLRLISFTQSNHEGDDTMMNRRNALTGTAALALAAGLPLSALAQKKLVLGFSTDRRRERMAHRQHRSIKQAAKDAGIELKFADAQQKQENQIKAIRSFIAQKVDVIAFSPVVEAAGRPCCARPRPPRSRSS
jgi:delta 1-pyrroline-5-carboxylate dehydrogenase